MNECENHGWDHENEPCPYCVIEALKADVLALKKCDATGYDRFEAGKSFVNRKVVAERDRLAHDLVFFSTIRESENGFKAAEVNNLHNAQRRYVQSLVNTHTDHLRKECERLREDIKQARLTISHGRALVSFGHVPTVRRALEWVLIDFDKALSPKGGKD